MPRPNYRETYTSFSGSDIVATFTPVGGSPHVIGELQAVTYSINREKAPINLKEYRELKV